MRVLIYSDYSEVDNDFEIARLRKNFKGALEMLNETYQTNENIKTYSVIQYFSIKDVTKLELNKEKNKSIIALLYQESDINGMIIKEIIVDGVTSYRIPRNIVEKINKFDACIVPCKEARSFLVDQGIFIRIYIYNPGIKLTRFDLENRITKDICYRSLGINMEYPLMFSIIREEDTAAIEKIIQLANYFKQYKIIVVAQKVNESMNKRLAKLFRKKADNVKFMNLLEKDIYASLMYKAKIFLSVNSSYSNVIEVNEAMACGTNIFALSSSVFKDIVIDKETGYVYNDLGSLIEGINKFSKGELPSLKAKQIKFVKNYSISECGKELIQIYKEMEKE